MRKVGGNGLWKFNNSLNMNSGFVTKMKYNIKTALKILDKKGITDYRSRWEFLKNKIRRFSMDFPKKVAQNANKATLTPEKT